jgi:threonine dehydrogenase-like Zn-dependent dehydrogenase
MTTRTGKAIVFEGIARARVRQFKFPPPTSGTVRIAVRACGVCQREWNVLAGRIERTFPTVMGHEPVGRVDAIGSDVTGFQPGQWVTGVGTSSLAAYDVVDARYIAQISAQAHMETRLGEPAMCAVNAVNRTEFGERPVVAVNGAGFMGSLLIQTLRAKVSDATILAIDPLEQQRVEAIREGADSVFPSLEDIGVGRRVDVVYEASGTSGAVLAATRRVRNGGTLCLFAHHFHVEPEAVNDWHMRGIAVLNTVPWAAPDLQREVREGVGLLDAGAIRLRSSALHVVSPEEAAKILSREKAPQTKLVVLFD